MARRDGTRYGARSTVLALGRWLQQMPFVTRLQSIYETYVYIYIYMLTLASRTSASPASTVLLVRGNLFTAKAMSPCAREG